MKLYIFAVVVLLYFQSSQASKACSCCETELANFKLNAKNFIADFKTLHDQSHDSVATIADICLNLFKLEYKFLSGDYSTDLNDARCKVKEYFDSTAEPGAELVRLLNSVNADSDTLMNLAVEFASKNDLTCQNCSFLWPKLRGCDAELNALKCEISAFFKDLKPRRDNAGAFITGTLKDLASLSDLTTNFVATTDLTCGGCGCGGHDKGAYCQLRIAANAFFVAFNKLHWASHIKFVNLQFICDDITRKVSTLNVKYSCL